MKGFSCTMKYQDTKEDMNRSDSVLSYTVINLDGFIHQRYQIYTSLTRIRI